MNWLDKLEKLNKERTQGDWTCAGESGDFWPTNSSYEALPATLENADFIAAAANHMDELLRLAKLGREHEKYMQAALDANLYGAGIVGEPQ